MCDNTNTTTQSIADYLSQLLKDRKQLAAFPNVFIHVERLLDEGELTASIFCSSLRRRLWSLVLGVVLFSRIRGGIAAPGERGTFPRGVTRGKM